MLALVAAASMLLSGCFLRSMVGFVDESGRASLSGNVQASHCDSGGANSPFIGCVYVISDGESFLDITSTFELITEFGLLGAVIDPLILQVPADATNVVATFNNAGTPQSLVLTEATSFPVTPTITVQAEAGTKFLILELPDAVAAALPPGPSDIDFSLDFDVSDPSALVVKPMLTASVDQAGTRYYAPLFPCVTDFAQVPELRIPGGNSFQDLSPQMINIAATGQQLACNQVTYDLRLAAPSTTTTTPSTTVAASTTTPPTSNPAVTSTNPPITLTTVLPETGGDTSTQIWVALGLLIAGAAALMATRRRPSTRTF